MGIRQLRFLKFWGIQVSSKLSSGVSMSESGPAVGGCTFAGGEIIPLIVLVDALRGIFRDGGAGSVLSFIGYLSACTLHLLFVLNHSITFTLLVLATVVHTPGLPSGTAIAMPMRWQDRHLRWCLVHERVRVLASFVNSRTPTSPRRFPRSCPA